MQNVLLYASYRIQGYRMAVIHVENVLLLAASNGLNPGAGKCGLAT